MELVQFAKPRSRSLEAEWLSPHPLPSLTRNRATPPALTDTHSTCTASHPPLAELSPPVPSVFSPVLPLPVSSSHDKTLPFSNERLGLTWSSKLTLVASHTSAFGLHVWLILPSLRQRSLSRSITMHTSHSQSPSLHFLSFSSKRAVYANWMQSDCFEHESRLFLSQVNVLPSPGSTENDEFPGFGSLGSVVSMISTTLVV
mmetsp:Transcript_22759/g.53804  ORF Transcript_22759/g.53804 Transcript_22759/m.53804 type:complete len:201 (+) Transcript_22759:685-1287(+)